MKQATVLLAEDDLDVRHVVTTLLKSNGFQVLTGYDGKHALEISRRFGGDIQVLLADIEMPGLTGIELARRVKAERPGTKVLLMSGYFSREGTVGIDEQFIAKPFGFEELIRQIKELLNEKSTAAPVG
jgi:DNA-binding response OmpR family regulator